VSRGPAEQALVRRSLSVLGVLSLGSLTGAAFSLYLVNHHPLLLIALSPIGRHLVLVAPIVDPVAFVAVAVLRRLAFYLACFQTGRGLGPSGVEWLEARAARFARFVRWVESLFGRAPHLVVLLMAGPTVSGLAGMTGMRLPAFLPLATVSLLLRMLAVLGFAELVREPIEWLLGRIDEYWVPGTAVMVTGTLLYQWRRIRRARARAAELALRAGAQP
jgi:membrane protein DedA with SNARE-associated domain